jgi:hypothetical protein
LVEWSAREVSEAGDRSTVKHVQTTQTTAAQTILPAEKNYMSWLSPRILIIAEKLLKFPK